MVLKEDQLRLNSDTVSYLCGDRCPVMLDMNQSSTKVPAGHHLRVVLRGESDLGGRALSRARIQSRWGQLPDPTFIAVTLLTLELYLHLRLTDRITHME